MKMLPRAVLFLTVSLILAGCSSGQRPTTAIREDANFHFKRGEYADAMGYYATVVERYPGDWEAQYRLGLCQLDLGNAFEARQALEIAHTRRPQHVGVVDALAEAMYLQGDVDRLFAFLRERADSTQSVNAYLRLSRYAIELGDPDSARTAIQTALKLDGGENVGPLLEAAAFAERIGDLDQAVAHLRDAYAIDPYNDQVKMRLRELGEIPGPTLGLVPDS